MSQSSVALFWVPTVQGTLTGICGQSNLNTPLPDIYQSLVWGTVALQTDKHVSWPPYLSLKAGTVYLYEPGW